MKKIILSCLTACGLSLLVGCADEPAQTTTTTTTEETSVQPAAVVH